MDEIESFIDQIYRLKPRKPEREGWTNNVIVNLFSKRIKEEIIKAWYENPIEYKGEKVLILRELPRQVVQFRKNMRRLTEKRMKKNIRFRWELPMGLAFP